LFLRLRSLDKDGKVYHVSGKTS